MYRIIRADEGGFSLGLKKLWRQRFLLLVFAKRELKVLYAETALGLLWSVVQPLIGLLVFTVFFSRLLKVDTGNIPYPLFALTGMSAWYYFAALVSGAGTSLMEMQHIIQKVSFPKLIIPLSKALSGVANLAMALILVSLLMLIYGRAPGIQIVFLPVLVLLLMVTGLSLGLWLSALTIRFRDFHHVIPYLMSFAIWTTPVFYPSTLIPEEYIFFLYLNPMAAIIEGFRWSVLGGDLPAVYYLISFIPVGILLITGVVYFRKIENKIVDFI